MESLKFKTNINCGGCIKAVRPFLDEVQGIDNWTVDTENPDKILSVEGAKLDASLILEAVNEAGFEILAVENTVERN